MFLRAHAHTTEHRGARERRVDRDVVQALDDLGGQLTRGRDDERPRDPARLLHDVMENREQERIRFAAARHRAGEDVTTLQSRRNRFSLNRGGTGKAELLEALLKARMQLQRRKRRRNGHVGLVWEIGRGHRKSNPLTK